MILLETSAVKKQLIKMELMSSTVTLMEMHHGGPTHLHVIGEGKPTKIGPQGLPVKEYPDLSPKQAKVVANNLPLIKKTIKQKQKILRTMKAR